MPASVLALVSSLHLAFVALRSHRSGTRFARFSLIHISLLAAITPWLFPEWPAILAGLAGHLAWFVATDRWAMAMPAVAVVPASPGPATRPPSAPTTRHQTPPAARAPQAAPAARASGWVPLPVLAVIDETPNIRSFRLGRPEGFDFKAGQFLAVRVRVDGKDQARCYSISSAPDSRGFLEISVKRQGLVSNALHATLRAGSTLYARSPAGAFVYPEGDDRPLVLIAGGVGITPLISMLRQATAHDPQRPVTLLQSARTIADLPFADELRVIERRYPAVRWVPAISGGDANPPAFFPGRIDANLLRTTVPDVALSVVCMCGPGAMIDDLLPVLRELGVPENQVRYERFAAAIASVGAVAHDHASHAAGHEPPAAESSAEGTDITFSKSGRQFCARKGETVLEAADAANVAIPSLCRAGVCGTCRTRVAEGDVACDSTVLPAGDRAQGYVLACVARARSRCVVEA